MRAERLAIVGAGELGIQILDLLNYATMKYIPVGFFDDTITEGSEISGLKVLGKTDGIISEYEKDTFDSIVIAIGYKHLKTRNEIYERFSNKIPFATIIHQSCIINSNSEIGKGSVIYAGCIIDKNVIIGRNVLLNLAVTVSHDSYVGNNSFLAPRVVLSGFVKIGCGCFIGTNATIIDNIKVSDGCIIGAGSVVIKNLEESTKVMGNPASIK